MVRVDTDGSFRHCLERHSVEVDLGSGEAPWRRQRANGWSVQGAVDKKQGVGLQSRKR